MTLFLMLLALMLLGGGLGWLFLNDPGYVLVAWQQTSVELSLSLAMLLLLLAAVAGLVLLELVLGVFGLRRVILRWSDQRKLRRAEALLAEGVGLLQRGESARGEKRLLQAARLSPSPFAAAWLASDSACRRHEFRLAEDYLELAAGRADHLPMELARTRVWLEAGQWESAAARLKSLFGHYRKEPALAELLVEALLRLQAWEELAGWMPRLAGLLGTERSVALAVDAHRQVLLWMAQTGSRIDRAASLKRLKEYWSGLPSMHQEQADLVEAYAEAMLRQGFDDEAEPLVRATLSRDWHNGLAALYGRIRSSYPDEALEQARLWYQKRPQNPLLLLTLGRLYLQNRDWEAARASFEQSLSMGKSTETYAEYVRLLQHLNDPEAAHYLVAGLQQLSNRPLPQLPLP